MTTAPVFSNPTRAATVLQSPTKAPPESVRASHFSFREPALLFSRVRLFPGYLLLEGWHWRGHYRQQVALEDILQVDVTSTGRLLIWLTTGETLRLRLDDAIAWRRAIKPYLEEWNMQKPS